MAVIKLLIAFDFDHTLVEENTDFNIIKLAPEEALPEEITSLYSDDGWIDFMGAVFKFLHNKGCSKQEILQCVADIPFTEGMKELLEYKKPNLDIDFIIISDSNSVFIDHLLDHANLSESILKVFTNPAQFDSHDCLTIAGYHKQDWCTLSSENLCKGHILKKFLQERQESSVEYYKVFYVGDGHNDLCPGLTLRSEDVLMPRIGFKLNNIIENLNEDSKPVKRSDIKAGVVPWTSGFDVIKQIEAIVN